MPQVSEIVSERNRLLREVTAFDISDIMANIDEGEEIPQSFPKEVVGMFKKGGIPANHETLSLFCSAFDAGVIYTLRKFLTKR